MSPRRRRRWTVLLVREGATRSHKIEFSEGKLAVLGFLAAGILAAVFVTLGRWSAHLDRAEHVAALEGEIARLEAENARVGLLGARVEDLERSYAQLRRVMSGEVEPAARDVLLPAPPTEVREASDRLAGGAIRDPALWPVVETGFVTRTFGDTSGAAGEGHAGLDIAVPVGSYVRAAGAGVVLDAGQDEEYGRYLRIGHAGDVSSLYAHNSWLFVEERDSVEAGEVVALSGNTGRSTAPHLHVEIERSGAPVDPLEFLGAGR